MDQSPVVGHVAASTAVNEGAASNNKTQPPSSAPPASIIGPGDGPLTGEPVRETSQPDTHEILQKSLGPEKSGQHSESDISRLRTSGIGMTRDPMINDSIAVDITPANSLTETSVNSGRGARRTATATPATNGTAASVETSAKMNRSIPHATPSARGRGRGPGRPRGSGKVRGGVSNGGRGGKRKREDREDEDDSDSSEVYTPIATTTKSGRSIQKPASYVPPPPPAPLAPTTTQSPMINKRKRQFYRRNPESAVCKICLRGTSPASNMIVFCDGCNTPYHRYCHHPPIDQTVVDEIDMEWYCRQCEKERFVPVPESQIAHFISAPGSSVEERRRYFSSLMPGMLISLLTKATTLQPDLPVFDLEFGARFSGSNTMAPPSSTLSNATNGISSGVMRNPVQISSTPHTFINSAESSKEDQNNEVEDEEDEEDQDYDMYGQDLTRHPTNYPRPGQGLMKTLPPDKDDAEWLVDDEDRSGTFTHIYRSDLAVKKTSDEEPGTLAGKDA